MPNAAWPPSWPGLLAFLPAQAFAFSRVKDLVDVEGIRDNMLVGYGLVVGLNGSGDSLRNAPFTQQSLQTMLERLGVNTRGETMQTKNVAAVMVTANLPAFSGQGTRIDISVSALGDAKSLQGGTLLVTPLFGADGNIYALAQGPVTIGGFSAQGKAASVTRGVPTAGRIANGAIVERQTGFKLAGEHTLKLSLRNPDLTTAMRIAEAIDRFIGSNVADATDPANVKLDVPVELSQGRRRHAERHRAAQGHARPGGQGRDRRTIRRHRHGRGCARSRPSPSRRAT